MSHYTQQEAWVVFSGKTDIRWLKILKSGFRHCFILLHDGHHWITIDPIAPHTDIEVYHHIESDFDLPKWLEARGKRVLKAKINKNQNKPAPSMICTCVEFSKRILGIHKRLIITPWQLYCHLEKELKSSSNLKENENGNR